MNLGIRGKLIAAFALGTMVPLVAVAGLTYSSVRHLLERRESVRAREIAGLISRGLDRATRQLEREIRGLGGEADVQEFLRDLASGLHEPWADRHRRMVSHLITRAGMTPGLIELRLMDQDGRDWFRLSHSRRGPVEVPYPLSDDSSRAYLRIAQDLSPPNFYVAGDDLSDRLRSWDPPGVVPLRCALPLMATDAGGQPIPVQRVLQDPGPESLLPVVAAAWIPAANARGMKARMGQVSRCATLVALIHPGSLVEDLHAGLAEIHGSLALVDRQGRLVAAFGDEPTADEERRLAHVRIVLRGATGEGWIEAGDRCYLPATWTLPGSWAGLGWEFLFSVPRASLDEGEVELRRIHIFALLLGLLTGAAAAWVLGRTFVGTQQWQAAQQELEHHRRLSPLGMLAGGVAHEVNNPVGTILTTARHLLSSPRFEGQSPEVRREIEKIDRQAERISRIVAELLIFARQSPRRPTPHRPEQVIREALRTVRELGRHPEFTVDCRIEPELPPVPMDEHKIHQVLVNLVSNALAACQEGGAVSVSCKLTAEAGTSWLEIEVQDAGRGIPPDDLARIFDPFFTTKPHGAGTGLGLSLVYGVIQDHHGKITVDSTVGKGTTFRIRLPLGEGAKS